MSSRRAFLKGLHAGSLGLAAASGLGGAARSQEPGAEILGAEGVKSSARPNKVWQPISDRKIRVGIVGYGVCQFGAAFGFQDHPNVTVAAVSDLFPDRCAALAKACRCEKTYPSLEELVKDDSIEAVFVATDAPSHARHCIEALKHGKHVACAVPAVFGSIEEAHQLHEAVKSSGRTYMMFETSAYHEDCHAMRQVYQAGGFGKLVYSEGEYYHYSVEQIPSYREWRVGQPPQWYPTHASAYYVMVSGGSFTEVSCLGMPSVAASPLAPMSNTRTALAVPPATASSSLSAPAAPGGAKARLQVSEGAMLVNCRGGRQAAAFLVGAQSRLAGWRHSATGRSTGSQGRGGSNSRAAHGCSGRGRGAAQAGARVGKA